MRRSAALIGIKPLCAIRRKRRNTKIKVTVSLPWELMMQPLPNSRPQKRSTRLSWTFLIALAVLVSSLLWLRDRRENNPNPSSAPVVSSGNQTGNAGILAGARFYREPDRTSEQIVARKVAQYA